MCPISENGGCATYDHCYREGTLEMRSSRTLDPVKVRSDDDNLVASAGLTLLAILAQFLDLQALFESKVLHPTPQPGTGPYSILGGRVRYRRTPFARIAPPEAEEQPR